MKRGGRRNRNRNRKRRQTASVSLQEDALIELLMQYGYDQVDGGDHFANLIAESYTAGWGPEFVEDIKMSKHGENDYSFGALITYSNEGAWSDEKVALADSDYEKVTGRVYNESGNWELEVTNSKHKVTGIIGDDYWVS